MRLLTFIFITVFILSANFSSAQSWIELNKEFNKQLKEKDFDSALKTAKKILLKSEKEFEKSSIEYQTSLRNLAVVYELPGNLEESIKYYHELYNLHLNLLEDKFPTFGQSMEYTRDYFGYIPDKKASIEVYKKAIDRVAIIDSIDYTAVMDITGYYSAAITNLYGGNDVKTEDTTKDDLIKKYGKESIEYQLYLDSLADFHMTRGRYNPSLDHYIQLYDIIKKTGKTQDTLYINACLNIGFIYYIKQMHETSYPFYQEGIELWETSKRKLNAKYVESLYYYGAHYMITQEWQKVIDVFTKAIRIIEKRFSSNHIMYTSMIASTASAYKVLENYDKTIEYYDKYYDVLVAQGDTAEGGLLGYYMGVGPVYEKTGQMDKAEEMYVKSNRETADIIRNLLRYSSLTTEKRLAQSFIWFNYNLNYFNSFCLKRYLERDYLAGEMYDNELVKKGLILRLIKAKIKEIMTSGDEEAIAAFKEWISIRQILAKLYNLPVSERKENVSILEKKAKLLESKMISGVDIDQRKKDPSVTWQMVQEKLKPGQAVVEFIHFDAYDFSNQYWNDSTVYCALILKPGDKYPKLVRLFTEPEFDSFLKRNQGRSPLDFIKRLYTRYEGEYRNYYKGDSLYHYIWKSVDPYLKDVKTVYYSPSGLLHKISFAAIPDDNNKKLVKKYKLYQLSSSSALVYDKDPFVLSKDIDALLYGGILYDSDPGALNESAKKFKEDNIDYFVRDRSFVIEQKTRGLSWNYLEGTFSEVLLIDSLLKQYEINTEVYTKTDAVEESFKYFEDKTPEILHIATHGFFLEEKKIEKTEKLFNMTEKFVSQYNTDDALMRSGLLFAGANNVWKGNPPEIGMEDGILTAHEVSKMDLSNTRLVVLSACETGLGEIKGSEGVYGLQRAFKIAGVEYIIMSLWQIPDQQTVELMNFFYSNWLGGMEIRDAFSQAQQTMSEKYDPFYWAAFVLVN